MTYAIVPFAFLASFAVGWYVSRMSYLRGHADGYMRARLDQLLSRVATWPEAQPRKETRAN